MKGARRWSLPRAAAVAPAASAAALRPSACAQSGGRRGRSAAGSRTAGGSRRCRRCAPSQRRAPTPLGPGRPRPATRASGYPSVAPPAGWTRYPTAPRRSS
eukprot:CAMPEP_0183362120 /NCGR_PEP_ID=MMETSP0164_2-20130417/66819_1 /TAXON_ID=221442 /ORGANISM="Coccolithus pelagicus ssp braarudi, Strain PLY182g" /LENGTH=100 /DNA_ID=CAMNT_0025536899 /DNA_START=303 /DNA_END=602 /DNA_ORIENTATION=-